MLYSPANKPIPGEFPDLAHPLCRGIVGWWMFNERAGLIAHDLSGKGNHGTLTNGPTWVGNTLELDGNDDYVATSFNFLSHFTLSAWVNVDSLVAGYPGAYECIISRGAVFDNNTNYAMGFRNRSVGDNRLYLYYRNGATLYGAEFAIPSPIGDWNYFVATYDGTTIKAYRDGVRLSMALEGVGDDTPANGPSDGSQSLKIGIPDTTDGTDDPFNGLIDDVRIYNRALSAAELQWLFENSLSAQYAEFPRLGISYFYPSAGPVISIPVIMLQHDHFDGGAI